MIVRDATPADADGIAVVHVDAWRTAYADIVPSACLAELSVAARAEAWRGFIGEPRQGARFFVAESKGIVGFASIGPSRDEDANGAGEVYAIYAAPSHWGVGVGRALINRATEVLDERFDAATLWVLADNRRARRFYELAGWLPDGASKSEQIGGRELTEIRYRKSM